MTLFVLPSYAYCNKLDGNALLFFVGYRLVCIVATIIGVNNYNDDLDKQIRLSEMENRNQENDKEFRLKEMYLKNQPIQVQPRLSSNNISLGQPQLSEWLNANPGKSINDYYLKNK